MTLAFPRGDVPPDAEARDREALARLSGESC